MIKVLVVEDDKFARQGLINTMPWEKHGMVVVGEATNGKTALEFLEKEQVNLILSDFSMPIMSGLDLLKAVQEKYPETMFAMITLYETFDIVQQALRYGAIDYISKLQLEEENYDQVLENLNELIKKSKRKKVDAKNSITYCDQDFCYVFSCINDQDICFLTKRFPEFFVKEPIEIGFRLYVHFLDEKERENEAAKHQYVFGHVMLPWRVTKVTGLSYYEKDHFFHVMREFYRQHLFYDNSSSEYTITQLENLISDQNVITEQECKEIEEKWLKFEWIYDKKQFNGMIEELYLKKLSFTVLFKLLVLIEDALVKKYSMLFTEPIDKLPSNFYCWDEVKEWLTHVYERMNRFIMSSSFSSDVIESIMKAVHIIHNETSEQIFATDISERVNMSRSYFCNCFKKITGYSFNQYVRIKRIEMAKYYLENTDLSIQLISDKTGYLDEKYFSKIFKSETGYLPSMYRKVKQNSSYKVI